MNESKIQNNIKRSVAVIIALALGLAITTSALVYSVVEIENNIFNTGRVEINLNDGKSVINENEYIFEPGMTVKKDFFIENKGTCDIYYRLYFKNIKGGLADFLEIKICDGDTVIFEGTPNYLSRVNFRDQQDVLKINEKRNLQIYFRFPENYGNELQNEFLTFDFAADGVQIKNNPNKNFNEAPLI